MRNKSSPRRALGSGEIQLEFGPYPRVEARYLSFNEIELAPEVPGWYAWIYVPDEGERLRRSVAKLARLRARVDGVFGLAYSGTLGLELDDWDDRPLLEPEPFRDCQAAMVMFAPPLYIGLAQRLRTRLRQHAKHLERELVADPSEPMMPRTQDTEEESSFFGRRVGAALRALEANAMCLAIKVVPARNVRHLREVEAILNHSFAPPFGRR